MGTGIGTGMGLTTQQTIQGSISGGLQVAAPFTGPFAPLVEGLALVTSLLPQFGCGSTCTLTSDQANAVANYLQQNLNAFQSGQIDKTTALANFQTGWNALVTYCSNPQMGNAGKRCIEDREGSRNGGNGKYDWFAYYYDPIENAISSSTSIVNGSVGSSISNLTSTISGGTGEGLLIGLGILVFGLFAFGD